MNKMRKSIQDIKLELNKEIKMLEEKVSSAINKISSNSNKSVKTSRGVRIVIQ